jgi:competence protein ComEC
MRTKLILIALFVGLFAGFSSDMVPTNGVTSDRSKPVMTVYVVDVGMGDAIFLDIPPGNCMLVDAGSWDNFGIENLMEFLDDFFSDPEHASYHNTLDVVLATHQHKDHIQGMLDVLRKYTVRTYIDNGVGCKVAKNKASKIVDQIEELLAQKSIVHEQLTENLIESHGQGGAYTDTLLDPFKQIDVVALAATPNPVSSNENDNSIVLKVTCKNVSFLLTGDAEKEEEERLMNRLKASNAIALLHAAVLKAGHHGSNTASSEEFVRAVNPKISVVSVGTASASPKTKSFRLPKESVMERLGRLTLNDLKEQWDAQMFPDKKPTGAKKEKPKSFISTKEIYLTSSDGTVALKTDGRKIEAGSYEYADK